MTPEVLKRQHGRALLVPRWKRKVESRTNLEWGAQKPLNLLGQGEKGTFY